MRISDWSSDVCSSDLADRARRYAPRQCRAGVGWRRYGARPLRDRRRHDAELGRARRSAVIVRRLDLDRAAHRLFRLGGSRAARFDRLAIVPRQIRSEEHTSELQSLMRISYAVFCLKKKTKISATLSTYYHPIR